LKPAELPRAQRFSAKITRRLGKSVLTQAGLSVSAIMRGISAGKSRIQDSVTAEVSLNQWSHTDF
jgi:hypothetical protein